MPPSRQQFSLQVKAKPFPIYLALPSRLPGLAGDFYELNLHPQTLSAWLYLGLSDPPLSSHPGSCSSSEGFPSGRSNRSSPSLSSSVPHSSAAGGGRKFGEYGHASLPIPQPYRGSCSSCAFTTLHPSSHLGTAHDLMLISSLKQLSSQTQQPCDPHQDALTLQTGAACALHVASTQYTLQRPSWQHPPALTQNRCFPRAPTYPSCRQPCCARKQQEGPKRFHLTSRGAKLALRWRGTPSW